MQWAKISYTEWKPMILRENHWYPTQIRGIQWQSIISNENQWYSMKVHDIQRKSKILHESQWYRKKTTGIARKQKYIDYKRMHIIYRWCARKQFWYVYAHIDARTITQKQIKCTNKIFTHSIKGLAQMHHSSRTTHYILILNLRPKYLQQIFSGKQDKRC